VRKANCLQYSSTELFMNTVCDLPEISTETSPKIKILKDRLHHYLVLKSNDATDTNKKNDTDKN